MVARIPPPMSPHEAPLRRSARGDSNLKDSSVRCCCAHLSSNSSSFSSLCSRRSNCYDSSGSSNGLRGARLALFSRDPNYPAACILLLPVAMLAFFAAALSRVPEAAAFDATALAGLFFRSYRSEVRATAGARSCYGLAFAFSCCLRSFSAARAALKSSGRVYAT